MRKYLVAASPSACTISTWTASSKGMEKLPNGWLASGIAAVSCTAGRMMKSWPKAGSSAWPEAHGFAQEEEQVGTMVCL